MTEKHKKKVKELHHLRNIFQSTDVDDDGFVSPEELTRLLQDSKLRSMLAFLDLDVYEVGTLFNLLDDGDGKVSMEEFVSGILRMRGEAKSIDTVTILCENRRIIAQLADIQEHVRGVLQAVDAPAPPATRQIKQSFSVGVIKWASE